MKLATFLLHKNLLLATIILGLSATVVGHREKEWQTAGASLSISLLDDDRSSIQATLGDATCGGDNYYRFCAFNVSVPGENLDGACATYGGSLVQGRQKYDCEAHDGSFIELELLDKYGCTLNPFINSTTVNETNIINVFQTAVSVAGHACKSASIDDVQVDGVDVTGNFTQASSARGLALPFLVWAGTATSLLQSLF